MLKRNRLPSGIGYRITGYAAINAVKDSALLLSVMGELEEQIRQAGVRSNGLGDPTKGEDRCREY